MLKTIIPFYIFCFALYIFFSRRRYYQDGEFTTGTIYFLKDSTEKNVPKAIFITHNRKDTIDAAYPFRNLKQMETVNIIYETSDPSKAAVYKFWGYWLQWDELLASILIPVIFVFAAKAITASPTPEALIEELEMRKTVKRKRFD